MDKLDEIGLRDDDDMKPTPKTGAELCENSLPCSRIYIWLLNWYRKGNRVSNLKQIASGTGMKLSNVYEYVPQLAKMKLCSFVDAPSGKRVSVLSENVNIAAGKAARHKLGLDLGEGSDKDES
jgi:hypothetical protein